MYRDFGNFVAAPTPLAKSLSITITTTTTSHFNHLPAPQNIAAGRPSYFYFD